MRIGGVFFGVTMPATPGDMPKQRQHRIAVYFDYENVHRTAHDLYTDYGTYRRTTAPHPRKLAERIAAKRSERFPSILTATKVYRGRPDPAYEPKPASLFDALEAEWRGAGCIINQRPLRYRDNEDGSFSVQEKGVDVALAVDLVNDALSGKFDAQIVFTSDTDMMPAIELLYYGIDQAHVEIACWSTANRLRLPGANTSPFCHFLNDTDFRAARSANAADW